MRGLTRDFITKEVVDWNNKGNGEGAYFFFLLALQIFLYAFIIYNNFFCFCSSPFIISHAFNKNSES